MREALESKLKLELWFRTVVLNQFRQRPPSEARVHGRHPTEA